jgi:signal transduction histidine kinase
VLSSTYRNFSSVDTELYQLERKIKSLPNDSLRLVEFMKTNTSGSEFNLDIHLSKTFLEVADRSGTKKHQILSRLHLANFSWVTRNFPLAISLTYEALKLSEQINFKFGIARSYHLLGVLFSINKDPKKSIEYNDKCAVLYRELNDTNLLKRILNNQAENYIKINQNQKAIELCKYVLDSLNDNISETNYANLFIGVANRNLKNYDLAIVYLNNALKVHKYSQVDLVPQEIRFELGELYYLIGNYKKTILIADTMLNSCTNDFYIDVRKQAYELFSKTYLALGNYKKATQFYKLLDELQDSLRYENVSNKDFEFMYNSRLEKEKSKFEVQNLENRNRSQRDKFIIIFLMSAFLAIVLFAMFLYSTNKKRKAINLKLDDANTTKNKLFSVISHDLKGPLSAFSELSRILHQNQIGLSDDDKKKQIESMYKTSSSILRLLDNLLSWSRMKIMGYKIYPESIQLSDLINEVVISVDLLISEKQLSVNINACQETSIYADRYSIEIVFRNILSNAIKFSNNGCVIDITVIDNLDNTAICVSDEGSGIDKESAKILFDLKPNKSMPGTKLEKGTGLGLVICREIIDLHGGKIWTEPNTPRGTKVIFTLNKE